MNISFRKILEFIENLSGLIFFLYSSLFKNPINSFAISFIGYNKYRKKYRIQKIEKFSLVTNINNIKKIKNGNKTFEPIFIRQL